MPKTIVVRTKENEPHDLCCDDCSELPIVGPAELVAAHHAQKHPGHVVRMTRTVVDSMIAGSEIWMGIVEIPADLGEKADAL